MSTREKNTYSLQTSLLDEPVPDIKTPILQPSMFAKAKNAVYKTAQKVKNEWIKWTNWLLDHIPEKPKVDEVLESFKRQIKHLFNKKEAFELKEGKSALKQFTTEYTIEGKAGYDAESFLREIKSHVVDLLKRIPETKIKMCLQCVMEKIDIKTGETKFARPAFWSQIEVNLKATDRDELYENMSDLIKEKKTKFERVEGTGWKFRSIIKLEIQTVKYKPLKGGSWIDLPDELKKKQAI